MTFLFRLGNAFPVGGCHIDPVTGLPIPIELGAVMVDEEASQPVPIMGVTIDCISGRCNYVSGFLNLKSHYPCLNTLRFLTTINVDSFVIKLSIFN